MDTQPPSHLLPLLERIERFYDAEVRPREDALRHRLADRRQYLDAEGRLHPEVQAARREIQRASGREGLFALHLPKSVGGGGLSRTEMFFVEEKVYRYGVGLNPAILAWTDGATPRVIFCSEHQRRRFAEPLVRGEKTSLNAVTEPEAGSNLFDMKTTAVRKGRRWVLNGHKALITNAFEADVANVLALTDPGQGTRSFTYFQFETREHLGKGYRTGRVYPTMFEDGLTGEIFLEDLELDDEAVLGERGRGFHIAMTSINWTRMRRAGMCSAWSKVLIDSTLERVTSRMIGARALGANQGVQWMIADMFLDWSQARALSLACLCEIDAAGPWWQVKWAPALIRNVALIKLANDESFYRVADRALQLHGGAGVMKDTLVNRLFLLARNLRIPGGTDEVQRTTIAETLGVRGGAP